MAGSRTSRTSAQPHRWRAALALSTLVLVGCPKSEDGKKAGPAASASAAPSAAPAASAAAKTIDAGSAKPAGEATAYAGTYSLSPGTYYIPSAKDYGSVKQAKDDPTKHVGEGTLSLAVDADGKVTGTIDTGPAAPGVVEGSIIDGEIRGFIRRKDPKDQGLTGTFTAKAAGDAVDGKLALAEANAAIVREGKLSLKKK